jgi:hypothetical protein
MQISFASVFAELSLQHFSRTPRSPSSARATKVPYKNTHTRNSSKIFELLLGFPD